MREGEEDALRRHRMKPKTDPLGDVRTRGSLKTDDENLRRRKPHGVGEGGRE